MKGVGELRECPPTVRHMDERRAMGNRAPLLAHHRDRARGHGFRDKIVPIGCPAARRDKKIPLAYAARVAADTGNLRVEVAVHHEGFCEAKQVAQFHGAVPPSPAAASDDPRPAGATAGTGTVGRKFR